MLLGIITGVIVFMLGMVCGIGMTKAAVDNILEKVEKK